MRRCKGSAHMYVNGKWERKEFELGYFHQWGINYEELRDGIGNYTVAIVELPDGRIIMPVADEIVFLPEEDECQDDDSHSKEEDSDREGYSEEDLCPYDHDDDEVNQCPSYCMGLCGGDRDCPMS